MAAIAEGERMVRTGSRWYAGLTSPALWTLIALIVIWEIAVQVTHVPVYILPAPSRIADEFVAYWPRLVVNGGVTVMEILIGFVISILIGVPLAVALVTSSRPSWIRRLSVIGSSTVPVSRISPSWAWSA